MVEVAGVGEMNLNNKIDALGVDKKELEKFTYEWMPGVKGKERLEIVGKLIYSLRERIEGSTGHIEDMNDVEAKKMRSEVSILLKLLDSEATAGAVEDCPKGVGCKARGGWSER